MTRTILVGLSAAFAVGLLFVNIYNSVVDAANWNAAESIAITRQYFNVANPGTFFRIASPINQALAVIAVIVCWRFGRVRYVALAALFLALSADLLTFGYFYPRLDVMFGAPLESTEAIRQAVSEWASMNWFRSGLCTLNSLLAMSAFVIIGKKSLV
jgi:hypothetical protein